jgi:chromosome segregation ATPase
VEQSKRDLEAKRDRLIKELEHVNQKIADVDNILSQLPMALQQLEVEKQEQARQTYQLHKSIKIVPGSAEADVQEIQIVDDIRLCAISVIQNALGPS